MEQKKIILEIIQSVKPELWWMLFVSCIVVVALLMIKGILETVVAYINFRADRFLKEGAKVNVRGEDGKIIDFNLRWIKVQTDKKEILILMRHWQKEHWAKLHNGDHDRRKGDES